MLSLHGMVIIASEIEEIKPLKYGSIVKIQVASEDKPGSTRRHSLNIYSSNNKDLEELKPKLQVGVVCEISHATWSEYISPAYANNPKPLSVVSISVESKNLRVLKIPFYYDNLPNITSEPGDVSSE